MDEDSILENAINYLKELQEKVKILEDESMKSTVASSLLEHSSQLPIEDDSSSSDGNFDVIEPDEPLPEIVVKLSEMNFLIRIHCQNQKGILVKMLNKIENLHLTIMSVNMIPFTGSSVDVTITAKMDAEFLVTQTDIVRKLRSAF